MFYVIAILVLCGLVGVVRSGALRPVPRRGQGGWGVQRASSPVAARHYGGARDKTLVDLRSSLRIYVHAMHPLVRRVWH